MADAIKNASESLTPNNPANKAVEPKGNRKRIPMSVPLRKLEVPDIEGYHLHWIADRNVGRALQAGYEFVDSKDVPLNQRNVATRGDVSGNTDLGSHISIAAGADGSSPERLNLMKLPLDFYLEDREKIDTRNAQILGTIFKGEKILGSERMSAEDAAQVYVDPNSKMSPALFNRRRTKA